VASRLIADDEDPGELSTPSAAPSLWTVPTLVLDADAALALLWPMSREADDVDAPRHGGDLRYLSALAGFAVDLVARARVLPTVRPNGPSLGLAMWRPIVTGADAVWLRAAVSARPPVSAASDQAQGPQSVAAAVDALVDAVVRSRLAATSATKPRKAAKSQTPWRAALIGPGRVFCASDAEVSALADALAQWASEAMGTGAVRACFRLVEPPEPEPADDDALVANEGDPDWRLEFALQAADEPSLVVDADQVWRSKGSLRALARHVPDPQETLLAELGRAVRLYPDLGRALRTAKPSALTLGARTAHDFLVETVPLLVAAGFGVLLPGWWTNPSARVGARLRVSTPSQPGAIGSPAGSGQDGLVDFDWQLAVGEQTLTEQELDDLVEAQQPLVRVRGQWMYVDHERLAQARAFLQRRAKSAGGRMSLGEVLHALGTPDEGPGGLPVLSVEADGWLGDLLSPQSSKRLEPVTAPPGFVGSLRPYQERGLAWLSFLESIGMGGILADDMGLGKTIELLALIARDLADESATDLAPTLLVCPMSLVGNWQREAARFTPHVRVHVHHGAERPRGKDFDAAVESSDLVVTTYALLARDAAALRKVPWRRLVLDEAQAVNNAATKAAVAARSILVCHRIAVTGTPVENRLADLWSLMEFANPRLLGTPQTVQGPVRHPDRAARQRRGRHTTARADPAIHAAPAEDGLLDHQRPAGEARDGGRLLADQRAGCALPGGCRRHARPDRDHRWDRAPRAGARDDDQAQAGVQPPGPVLARRQPTGRSLGQAGPAGRDLGRGDGGRREGAAVHPVRDVRCDVALAPHRPVRPRGGLPARQGRQGRSGHDGGAVPGRRAGHPTPVRALAQGGRHWPEPDRCQPCRPRRPVVEPRCRRPGHRPGLPDRADQVGAGAQVRLRRNAGGEDRRDDPGQAWAGGEHRRHRRGLAHRAVDHGAGAGRSSHSRWLRVR